MADKAKNIFRIVFFEVISAMVITYSVVPAFGNIGHLFYQVFTTAAIVILFLCVVDSNKIKPVTVSHSLIFMTVFWIVSALIAQVNLHIRIGDRSFSWLHLFLLRQACNAVCCIFRGVPFFCCQAF